MVVPIDVLIGHPTKNKTLSDDLDFPKKIIVCKTFIIAYLLGLDAYMSRVTVYMHKTTPASFSIMHVFLRFELAENSHRLHFERFLVGWFIRLNSLS